MKNKKEKRVTKALEIIGLKSEVNFHIETIKELKEIVEFYISRIEEEDVYKKTLEENCEFYEKEIKKMENDMKEMSKEYISNYEEVYYEKKEIVKFYISRIKEIELKNEENCEFYEKEIKKMENDMKEISKEYISNYEEVYDEKKELQVENYHLKSEIKLLKENNMILKVIEDIKKKGI